MNEREVRQTLNGLKTLVRRMSGAPGQRSIVLMSSGFLQPSLIQAEVTDVMQRAVRNHVVISALSLRGVSSTPASINTVRGRMEQQGDFAEEGLMDDLAAATGGSFVHNTNDFGAALERIAAPEVVYLLGFSPTDLKYDGSFHKLKVTLQRKGLDVQVMKGYYAPSHFIDPVERGKQDLHEELFSRDELQAFPLKLKTEVSRLSGNVRLTATVHVDMSVLPFDTAQGRHSNKLTIVYGLFDGNGKLLHTMQQKAEMHWKPEHFKAQMEAGLDAKVSFDVQPGKYGLRVVVRDERGEMMSAQNGTVEVSRN